MATPPVAVGLDQLCSVKVASLPGVPAGRVKALELLGVENLYDLVTYFPRRYIDRTRQALIADAVPGEQVVLVGRVEGARAIPTRGKVSLVEATLADESGSVTLRFFRQPYRAKQLNAFDREVAVFGRVELFRHRRYLVNPVVDPIGDRTGQIVPIYPQREEARINSETLGRLISGVFSHYPEVADTVPRVIRSELGLLDRWEAFQLIHRPAALADTQRARRRIAFDELFRIQIVLGLIHRTRSDRSIGIAHRAAPFRGEGPALVSEFLERLPFELTSGQRRAIEEIASDMASPAPMHRLLQGDVGSGKTLVSLLSMLIAVQGGYQAALLAPTEVLAEQHFRSISGMLAGHRVREQNQRLLFADDHRQVTAALLTGSTPKAKRTRLLGDLAQGRLDIVVGTHALLSDDVSYRRLGLVVVDEQHRFGVEQRSLLRDRVEAESGVVPDTLVMTATPIPRTAAMTVFGDLDLSVIDTMPPGRRPVATSWPQGAAAEEETFSFLRSEVERGRQAYVVCPLVSESDRIAVKAVEKEYERLVAGPLAGLRVGLLHGKLHSKVKEAAMEAFRRGEVDVLVATTVIEVGVDVPNATVIVVEDAGRFGIAQLHQLRGRVGRGSDPSSCFLFAEADSLATERRLQALCSSTDGFELAEIDLELRGEGTILGDRQSGRSDLKLASILRDRDLVGHARRHAAGLIAQDPYLENHPWLTREIRALFGEEEVSYLLRS